MVGDAHGKNCMEFGYGNIVATEIVHSHDQNAVTLLKLRVSYQFPKITFSSEGRLAGDAY